MNNSLIPRSEYPRPEAKRDDWQCLNGEWDFEFDAKHIGMKEAWHRNPSFSRRILVPFVYQSKLSGINCQDFIDLV
ncbi:MAG: glycoside hydrolase family 2, partial [Promethearchaeota archaeon]